MNPYLAKKITDSNSYNTLGDNTVHIKSSIFENSEVWKDIKYYDFVDNNHIFSSADIKINLYNLGVFTNRDLKMVNSRSLHQDLKRNSQLLEQNNLLLKGISKLEDDFGAVRHNEADVIDWNLLPSIPTNIYETITSLSFPQVHEITLAQEAPQPNNNYDWWAKYSVNEYDIFKDLDKVNEYDIFKDLEKLYRARLKCKENESRFWIENVISKVRNILFERIQYDNRNLKKCNAIIKIKLQIISLFDLRFQFRTIIRFLFKNMDDESYVFINAVHTLTNSIHSLVNSSNYGKTKRKIT
jgi:hypothetical protein